jgi:putative ABC transport system permease protein
MSTIAMQPDDLDRELRTHLDLETEELRQSGLRADEASYAARRVLGNTALIKESVHNMSNWVSLERLWQDLRYGVRLLRRSPGFSLVAIVTLALGIGANTAIFSVVNAVMLRPLPYHDAGRLMRFWPTAKASLSPYPTDSYPNFLDWKTQSRNFEQIATYNGRTFSITGGDQPERAGGLLASAGLLQLLGVGPILGRTFTADEIRRGADHVVLLSEGLWRSHFAADAGVLGKTVKLNEETYTVIGVLPAGFQFPPDRPVGVVLPQPPDPDRGHGFLNVVGRLKTGVTISQAQAEMDTIARRLEQEYPKYDKAAGVRLMPLQESFSRSYRAALSVFLGAVGFVLLIACANVANLFVARAAGRNRELVLRAAMGAGRLRLARQLLTESVLLGIAGGATGLLFAYWGMHGLVALVCSTFATHAFDNVSIDRSVLGFTLAISLAAGLAAGLAPALGVSRLDLNEALKEGSLTLSGSRRRNRTRAALVVAEIAMSLMLLTGAGLMLKSFVLLERVNPGLHPENILTMSFGLGSHKYAHTSARSPFVADVLSRLQRIPGVQSAAVVADLPLTDNTDGMSFSIEGRPDPNKKPSVNFNIVGPGYLRTLGIPLLRGRDFSERDTENAPTAILINESMARTFWPQQEPVGARISTDGQHWFSIVGVVGDVRQGGLREDPVPEVYVSYLQDPYEWPYLSLLVRTSSDPRKLAASMQRAIWSVDKDLPISSMATMEELRSKSIAEPRLAALMLSVFASLALILASVGIYGVMAHSVTQRMHEMGLRMALGAQRRDVLRLVVGQGTLLAAFGVVLGLAGAFPLTKVLTKFLWGVRPTDPMTFTAVVVLLALVAVFASYVPARRATKADPMAALRYE